MTCLHHRYRLHTRRCCSVVGFFLWLWQCACCCQGGCAWLSERVESIADRADDDDAVPVDLDDDRDDYLPIGHQPRLAAARMAPAQRRRVLLHRRYREAGAIQQPEGPLAGPISRIVKYIEDAIAAAEQQQHTSVIIQGADVDRHIGYAVPRQLTETAVGIVALRRIVMAASIGPQGEDVLLDWHLEDMDLLLNPVRHGEPEDAGHDL